MSKQIILAILRGSKDYNNDPQYGEGKVESIKEEVKELGIEVDLIEEHLSEEKAQSFYIRGSLDTRSRFKTSLFNEWLNNNQNILKKVSTQNNNQREPETSTGNSNGNYNFFTLENINDPKKQKAEMEKDIINQNWEEGVRKLIKGQGESEKLFKEILSSWKQYRLKNKIVDILGNGDDVGFNAVEEEIFLDFDETFFSKACLVPRIKSIYENLETLIKESFSIPLSRDDKDFIITKIETKFKIELMEKQKNKVKSLAKYLTRLAIEELLTENPLEQNVNQTSWENKLMELTNQNFTDNTKQKLIAQSVAYNLISKYGFLGQNSAAEAKALKLKEILSKYKVELDLNRIKEIVCEAWQVFHAGFKNDFRRNISFTWTVPNEKDKIDFIYISDKENENMELSSFFPTFPYFFDEKGYIEKMSVVEIAAWKEEASFENDKNKPLPTPEQLEEESKRQAEKKKRKEAEEIKENIKNLADKNLSEEKRREALEELERKEGKNSYQNKKTEFQNSKKELFNQNPSEYKKTMAKVFKKKLIINELDETPELVNLVNEWESSNFDNYEKSEVLENKVKQKIGQTAASNKINKIESRIEKAIKSGNKSEMLSVLKVLLAIVKDTSEDIYLSEYKNQTQNWVKKLEGKISENRTNLASDKGFFRPEVLIPVVLGIIFLASLTVAVIRSKRKKITK